MNREWLHRIVVFSLTTVLLLAAGIVAYAAHVRASARAVINAVSQIRSAADAEHQAQIWRQTSREYSEFSSR
jgi:hypothetical protein